MVWEVLAPIRHGFLCMHSKEGLRYHQKRCLVNVKLKWVKDPILDSVVSGERDLKAASTIVSMLYSHPRGCLPVHRISIRRGQIGLSPDLKVSTFMRRYPNIFDEFFVRDTGGTRVPWFKLTPNAIFFCDEELALQKENECDSVERLCKLLMLTKNRTLPLHTIDQLKWDMGLLFDYHESLVPRFPKIFSLVHLLDDRLRLKLLAWDNRLAVSHLENSAKEEDVRNGILSFPIGFTRGFGLKRKCMEWLQEWQKLPYTSPYSDPSHLDPRTDASEKRIVGVFHEFLHLTLRKKTERQNVCNLRKPLLLPQKFTKVFERHPGIFYISKKDNSQTVVLRDAYDHNKLVHNHPLSVFRERFSCFMKEGFLDKSRGLYKTLAGDCFDGDSHVVELNKSRDKSSIESDCNILSDYESDDVDLYS